MRLDQGNFGFLGHNPRNLRQILKNDGLEDISPLKYGYLGYVIFLRTTGSLGNNTFQMEKPTAT